MAGEREQIRPYAAWSGRDRIDGETVDTVTVIFRTRGCSYGRCRMCAYRHVRDHHPDERSRLQDLSAQLRYFLQNYPVEPRIEQDTPIQIENRLIVDGRELAYIISEIIQRNRIQNYQSYGGDPFGYNTAI